MALEGFAVIKQNVSAHQHIEAALMEWRAECTLGTMPDD